MSYHRTSKTRCCVFACRNAYYNTDTSIIFYNFPNKWYEKERKEVWINNVRRTCPTDASESWRPKIIDKICSVHFVGNKKSNDPRKPAYNPTIFSKNQIASNQHTWQHADNSSSLNFAVASTSTLDNFVDINELKPPLIPGMSTLSTADPLDHFMDTIDVKPVIKLEVPEEIPQCSSSADSSQRLADIIKAEHDYTVDLLTPSVIASSSNSTVGTANGPQQTKTFTLRTVPTEMLIENKKRKYDMLEGLNEVASEVERAKCKVMVDASTETASQSISSRDYGSQTTFTFKDTLMLKEENARLKREVTTVKNDLSKMKMKYKYGKKAQTVTSFVHSLRKDDKKCKFYTGLYFQQIQALFEFLSPVDGMIYHGSKKQVTRPTMRKLTPFEELVITLVRLSTGSLIQDMSYGYNISTGFATRTISTWIEHASRKFGFMRLDMVASRESVTEHLPAAFKWSKDAKVSVECAEFLCERGSQQQQQQGKTETSYKVLLGCALNGAVLFTSDLFPGSLSDREIVEQSKLCHFLETGGFVLASSSIRHLSDLKSDLSCIPSVLVLRDTLTEEDDGNEEGAKEAQEEVEGKETDEEVEEKVAEGEETGVQTEVQGEVQAKAQTEVQAKVQTEVQAKVQTEVQTGVPTKKKRVRRNVRRVVGRLKQFRLLQKTLPLSMRDIVSQTIFVCACLLNFQGPVVKKEESA